MLLIWKNRGILVPIFIVLFVILSIIIDVYIQKTFHIILNTNLIIGIGIILSAVFTYLLREEYYKNNNGEKRKLDSEHSFFFISMANWSYLEFFVGIGMTIYGIVRLVYIKS